MSVMSGRGTRRQIFDMFEEMVIRTLLTKDQSLWGYVEQFVLANHFTSEELEMCYRNVDRWMRLHGAKEMEKGEKDAVLVVQSFVRRHLVLNRIRARCELYRRLALIDDATLSTEALKLERILARAREHMHKRKDMVQSV